MGGRQYWRRTSSPAFLSPLSSRVSYPSRRQRLRRDLRADELDAVQDDGGKVWVSVRRVCENLGLSHQGQQAKLKNKEWACVKEIVSHDTTGREQPATMLDPGHAPMWLGSIETRK